MKKFLFVFAVMMSATLFTSCLKNDNDGRHKYVVSDSKGAYLVCSGNSYSGVAGFLTYYDYTSKSATKDIYSAVNGTSLGMTPNDVLRYGEKLYIVVDGEHTVFVCNAKTQKLIKRIDMTASDMLGAEDGVSPRRIAADDGKIYVSTFGGYVAAIDTISFSLVKKYQAGSYPEGLAISNGYMVVANSNYSMGTNPSISFINLTDGSTQTLKNENIRNPQDVAIAGADIYYLDGGTYGPAPTYIQENAGVYKLSGNTSNFTVSKIVTDATSWACVGTKIYTIASPYGTGNPAKYAIFDISSGSSKNFTPEGIDYPACIGVDPLTGNIYIAAYNPVTNQWGTYGDTYSDGFVNIYDSSFSKVGSFTCGINPTRFAFNIGTEEIEY